MIRTELIIGLVILAGLIVAACGGGGGGSDSQPSQPPAQQRTSPLKYGYFGVEGDQIAETADHVNVVFAMDWGEPYWNTREGRQSIGGKVIEHLQAAKARGIKEAWIGVGFLTFTTTEGCDGHYCYHPRTDLSELREFKTQLQALGLYEMVTMLYPVDEPELHGLTDATLSPLLQAIKTEWSASLGVIYGDTHDYPGIRLYDKVGKDKYGAGPGVLNELPPITVAQQHLLVPGGACGLSDRGPENPQPFYDYAKTHESVYAIVPFVWFEFNGGCGIRNGPYRQEYVNIGKAIKG